MCHTEALWLSLRVALILLPLYLLLGVPLAWALARGRFPLRGLADALVTLPLVFPPIAIGFFLLLLLGRRGPLGGWLEQTLGVELVFSFGGVLVAGFVAGLPLLVKPVQAAMEGGTRELIEAAYTLGKGPFATLFLVVLPTVRASVAGGLALAIGRALGEVGITLMLGGNIIGRTDTLSLAIYNSVLDGDFGCANRLATLLGAVSLLLFLLLRRAGTLR